MALKGAGLPPAVGVRDQAGCGPADHAAGRTSPSVARPREDLRAEGVPILPRPTRRPPASASSVRPDLYQRDVRVPSRRPVLDPSRVGRLLPIVYGPPAGPSCSRRRHGRCGHVTRGSRPPGSCGLPRTRIRTRDPRRPPSSRDVEQSAKGEAGSVEGHHALSVWPGDCCEHRTGRLD